MSSSVRANYITNLSLSEASGGWSGFNAAIFASLARHYSLEYVGPVAPPADLLAKVASKAQRTLGLAGGFQFFSERRLDRIALEVERRSDRTAALDFFHGSTPWIATRPLVPYACYLDVCFATYLTIYHARGDFSAADVARIERAEAEWLGGATKVFFSSAWALAAAARAYGLDAPSLSVAGMGGHIPIPSSDTYEGGHEFLFIALDFAGKGGEVCVEAFERVRREAPVVGLRIVGEKPPERVLQLPGVTYEGRLDKAKANDLRRLQELLAAAFALVHPTVKDATPQVIVEAQYHGCPAIAPRSFGIPEMVVDGVTGLLVDAPPTASDVAQRMLALLRQPAAYRAMRAAARARALEQFTWEQVGDRMASEMSVPVA